MSNAHLTQVIHRPAPQTLAWAVAGRGRVARPELSVSLNTVSTHLRSIYAKLQVRDRSSAVQHAR